MSFFNHASWQICIENTISQNTLYAQTLVVGCKIRGNQCTIRAYWLNFTPSDVRNSNYIVTPTYEPLLNFSPYILVMVKVRVHFQLLFVWILQSLRRGWFIWMRTTTSMMNFANYGNFNLKEDIIFILGHHIIWLSVHPYAQN